MPKRSRISNLIGVSVRVTATPILLGLALLLGCKNATAPVPPRENNSPVLISLVSFPTTLGPGDSCLVICQATDADGDTLFYDWFSDSGLIIQGNAPDDHDLYDTVSNTHVFYYGSSAPSDSIGWVQCGVRDHQGGSTGRVIQVKLTH